MTTKNELSPAMKIFAWRGKMTGALPAPASSALDIMPVVTESVSIDAGVDQVPGDELSPAMKIFAWRGKVTGAPPAPASSAPDVMPTATETVPATTRFGEPAMNSNAFPHDFRKKMTAAFLTPGSVLPITRAMPRAAQSEAVLETELAAVVAGIGPGTEEFADYTLRAWSDGELARHLTIRLARVSALQFMYCFAADFPSGSDVCLYVGLHEHDVNIPIGQLVSEVRVPSALATMVDGYADLALLVRGGVLSSIERA
jgi:hypothetical protein